jgi:hypothetical protein
MTESVEPMLTFEKMEYKEPVRMKLRSEMEEPMVTKSRTELERPPRCELRRLNALPSASMSRTEAMASCRKCEKMDIVEASFT